MGASLVDNFINDSYATLSIKIILSYKLALELLISELQSLLSLSQHHAANVALSQAADKRKSLINIIS